MAKNAAKPKRNERNGEGQVAQNASSQTTISKAEAVRQALSAGMDAPADGTAFIKSHYGIDMLNQTFSSYKAQQKARDTKRGPAAKPGRKPKAESQAVEGYLSPPQKIVPTGEGDLLNTLEALKPLIARHGADKLKRMVDLLG